MIRYWSTASNPQREPAFEPATPTPVGASLELPSQRGKPVQAGGRGPTAHADQAPGADVYFRRAQAMHASRADVADQRTERAAVQREARRQRRGA